MQLRVKNWREFQHYRDRNPPWIKLHFSLLSSPDWVMLDDSARVLAVACMLLASRSEGVIDGSPDGLGYLQRVAYLKKPPDLTPLITCGFLESASGCKQMLADARPEERQRREEVETEKKARAPAGNGQFTPTPETRAWAESHGYNITFDAHVAYFRDYLAQGRRYKDHEAAFRNCLRSDWGGLRKAMGVRTIHGAGTIDKPPPCAHCSKPITGGFTKLDIGKVCSPCYKGYQEGTWK